MLNHINTFIADEDGAVTVDWVVLTAAIVGIGIAVLTTVGNGIATIGSKVAGERGEETVSSDASMFTGTGTDP